MGDHPATMSSTSLQDPIAIIGMALRLPGHCRSPRDFWEFMERGGVAKTDPPVNRFSLNGHYDGSCKPYTMKTPGAMFLEDVDPADFDAQFFGISPADASSMDPQQRLLLEVVYECLENAGIPLESLGGKDVACLVGASAVDYHDMISRDPEDRTESPTTGAGRALLSNRISHFLNIHGPSMTIDTACSSSLVALDTSCLYLQTKKCDAALVCGVNLYLSPERNEDMGAMRPTASATGRCHALDSKADGYVAAEAVNAVFIKRLADAVRDRDPIRAVIRGTATNSAGRTPGIAMPDATAQAAAIRSAYTNGGISEAETSQTGYLECHGTGTQVGDPVEVAGISAVFTPWRAPERPLAIGSVKSNIGHSEAAAGLSGVIKGVLALEHSRIPGTPTFLTPNPKINFQRYRMLASRTTRPWPSYAKKRVSINSFGFGGANAHAVIESPEYLLGDDYKSTFHFALAENSSLWDDWLKQDEEETEPRQNALASKLIVLSANDETSLQTSSKVLAGYLLNPAVTANLQDLAFTLSERRSRLFHRAFSIQTGTKFSASAFEFGKSIGMKEASQVGFVFTGQGAQWSQMGKHLLTTFPQAKKVVEDLDEALQSLPEPPKWSLFRELTEARDDAHLRQPEFSQPLATALQLSVLAVLSHWNIHPTRVIGHSSGEIAAAVAAGFISSSQAIKIAYLRGQASRTFGPPAQAVGMLAVGVGSDSIQRYIDHESVQIACYNSARSLTLAGTVTALDNVRLRLLEDGHFARLLLVDLAYHSSHMESIGERYVQMLNDAVSLDPVAVQNDNLNIQMFSTVTGHPMEQQPGRLYWLQNMVSPVLFEEAMRSMLEGEHGTRFLVEIGPSNTLKGPISHIVDSMEMEVSSRPIYTSAIRRGETSCNSLLGVAGKLFVAGGAPNMTNVNNYEKAHPPSVLVDLPNYSWNHSQKHWHESQSSKDWRFRPFLKHDLLGTKILGTPWQSPVIWRSTLRLRDHPWLSDHRLGEQVVFPGAGYIALAIEAVYQVTRVNEWADSDIGHKHQRHRYKLRDIKFKRALVLEDNSSPKVMTSVSAASGIGANWYEFKVSSISPNEKEQIHASGFIRIEYEFLESCAPAEALSPLQLPVSSATWYKAMAENGMHFGPAFQNLEDLEYVAGQRVGRAVVSLKPPVSKWGQSAYVMHPACIDGCFQTVVAATQAGDRVSADAALVPLQIDSLIIPWRTGQPDHGVAVASSEYVGVGRMDTTKSFAASTIVYHPTDGSLLLEMKGLRYAELEINQGLDPTAHCYLGSHWDLDVSHLSVAALDQIARVGEVGAATQRLLDLVAHKHPRLGVFEFILHSEAQPLPAQSQWLLGDNDARRASCGRYVFSSTDAEDVVSVQRMYPNTANSEFTVTDPHGFADLVKNKGLFDLVLLNVPGDDLSTTQGMIVEAQKILNKGGYALLVFDQELAALTTIELAANEAGVDQVLSVGSLPMILLRCSSETPGDKTGQTSLVVHRLTLLQTSDMLQSTTDAVAAHLVSMGVGDIASICDPWQLAPGSHVLIMDELGDDVMANLDGRQWEILQHLVRIQCHILWVTTGAQMLVTNPSRAIIQGFFRVLRNEEPKACLTTLDVDPTATPQAVARTICQISQALWPIQNRESDHQSSRSDDEYVERNGQIFINRIQPDASLNKTHLEKRLRPPVVDTDLHAATRCIRLQAEQVGSLDSLVWSEIGSEPLHLSKNCVEIEVFASGVNFKEVAVTLGIVPENEYLLGGEGAGVVTRIAPDVTKFKPGDRVLFFEKGSFGNRAIATTQRVRRIPSSMTYEQAATIPAAFLTSMFALYRLGCVKKGHRVLIHSATGGVGLAAIQLCQHVGAEVFATVGSKEKRELLISQFGIPEHRIFSSRTNTFGDEILRLTKGKGVDVILNSLTGELLQTSWRIISDGGTMVEIGKKDILDRNYLSMEPFGRNASYRAFDLSHKEITDELLESLLGKILSMVEAGSIKPITPVKIFSFSDIPSSLRLMRSGKHLGKIVISNGPDARILLPVRPTPPEVRLRPDVCYLIVGGLGGLCSSLAVSLVRQGAKHIAVMSRNNRQDDHTRRTIRDAESLGASIYTFQGDVCKLKDIEAVFRAIRLPVAGIVQGAMVLRDRTFESMTVEDYHAALKCKVTGTWNLHTVSERQCLELDFFILLSSISGLCGSKGQANYAAGNSFLDAFATFRRQNGKPATSIDLGVIQDVGYMAEKETLQKRYDEALWQHINERLLREIFHTSLLPKAPEQYNNSGYQESCMVTGIRFPQPANSPLLMDARFGALYRPAADTVLGNSAKKQESSKDVQTILLMLESKGKTPAALNATVNVLNTYLARSLRMSEALDATRALATYGIDSLAAVELRNWVRMHFGVQVSSLEIMTAQSLISLCDKVISRIGKT
ncbi:putative polyketide synthase [Astrocystis sublimbata]|nr:putative polyketide synthase [Astrocystis sublimbata]